MMRRLEGELTEEIVMSLRAGDQIRYSGTMFTARDAAHKRLAELLEQGKKLPFNIENGIIYYVGPTPAKPGQIIGSAGPTTSYRMDAYTPGLLAAGLKGMIGKGMRSDEVKACIRKNKCVYFAATGGAAALIGKTVKKAELVCYEDLGAEAIRLLEVEDFPMTVVLDCYGGDLYEQGKASYLQTKS